MAQEIRNDVVRESEHFVHGQTWSREHAGEEFRFVVNWMRPRARLWFTAEPQAILAGLGIATDARRAEDLANMFDGALSGYYYVEAASDGTDEAIKWMLGGLAAHLNETGLPFSAIHHIMPADYLRAFVSALVAARFDRMFAKAIFAELLVSTKTSSAVSDDGEVVLCRLTGKETVERIAAEPRFRAVDGATVDAVIEAVIAANPDNVARLALQPKLLQWFVGQVMKGAGGKASAQDVMARLQVRLVDEPAKAASPDPAL
jgi:Asp-tRNA(Asn)/Glu-tRNA(Gln) amidotransferase B subunit